MKKFGKSAAAAVLTGSMLLCACGSGSSAGTTAAPASSAAFQAAASAAETTAAAETSAPSGDKIEIEYWHVNSDSQGGQTVDELVKKFNESNDHIHVTAKYNQDMYKGLMQNLQAEEATGNAPALCQVGWAFLDYFSNNFPYVAPQDAIDKYDSSDKTFLTDHFLPNVLNLTVNSNGDTVGIPYSVSDPVLYINRDLLKEAGLSEEGPKTWEEVHEFAKTVTEKTGKYGFYCQTPADFWAQQALIESNGGSMIQKDASGKTQAAFAFPEGIETMQLLRDMITEGCAMNVSWDEGCQSFIDGSCAMLYTTIARRASIQKGAAFDAASVMSPTFGDKPRKVPAGGCFLAITAQDDEQIAAAWEFEKYLYSIESMAAWTIGTGYTPPRKDVADAENGLKSFLAENEMMKAAIDESADVVSWTSFPGDAGLQCEQLLLDMRDQILSGQQDVGDVMKSTQDQINQLLNQ